MENIDAIQNFDILSDDSASTNNGRNEKYSVDIAVKVRDKIKGKVDSSSKPVNLWRHQNILNILMGKLDGLKQVILQKSDELEVGELQELESLIRSQIYKRLAKTNKTTIASKTATIETIRRGSKTFRLRQTSSGNYWYLYWYDNESKKKQSKSLGKDSPELRHQHSLPPDLPSLKKSLK